MAYVQELHANSRDEMRALRMGGGGDVAEEPVACNGELELAEATSVAGSSQPHPAQREADMLGIDLRCLHGEMMPEEGLINYEPAASLMPSFFPAMSRDANRMQQFSIAISKAIAYFIELQKRGPHVVDLGAGTGMMAYAALRAGASKVTLVDVNQDVLDIARRALRAHQYVEGKHFSLFCGSFTQMKDHETQIMVEKSGEEKFDMLVCEILGTLTTSESQHVYIPDALRSVKVIEGYGQFCIPASCTQYISLWEMGLYGGSRGVSRTVHNDLETNRTATFVIDSVMEARAEIGEHLELEPTDALGLNDLHTLDSTMRFRTPLRHDVFGGHLEHFRAPAAYLTGARGPSYNRGEIEWEVSDHSDSRGENREYLVLEWRAVLWGSLDSEPVILENTLEAYKDLDPSSAINRSQAWGFMVNDTTTLLDDINFGHAECQSLFLKFEFEYSLDRGMPFIIPEILSTRSSRAPIPKFRRHGSISAAFVRQKKKARGGAVKGSTSNKEGKQPVRQDGTAMQFVCVAGPGPCVQDEILGSASESSNLGPSPMGGFEPAKITAEDELTYHVPLNPDPDDQPRLADLACLDSETRNLMLEAMQNVVVQPILHRTNYPEDVLWKLAGRILKTSPEGLTIPGKSAQEWEMCVGRPCVDALKGVLKDMLHAHKLAGERGEAETRMLCTPWMTHQVPKIMYQYWSKHIKIAIRDANASKIPLLHDLPCSLGDKSLGYATCILDSGSSLCTVGPNFSLGVVPRTTRFEPQAITLTTSNGPLQADTYRIHALTLHGRDGKAMADIVFMAGIAGSDDKALLCPQQLTRSGIMADFKIQTVIEIGPEGTSRQAKGVAVFDSAKVLGWERHEDESLPDIKLIADDGGTGNGSVQCSLRPIYDLDRLTRVLERGKASEILADSMDSRAVAEEMLAPRHDRTEAETPYQRLPGVRRSVHENCRAFLN